MPVDVREAEKVTRGVVGTGGNGHHGPPYLRGNDGRLRALQDDSPPPGSTAIWVGIAAITMTFAALTSAMVVRQGSSMDWRRIVLPNILFANTLILLASSVTLELFRRRFITSNNVSRHNNNYGWWLYATLSLGIIFLAGQYLAWRELAAQGVYLASNPSSSFFYLLTAAHGVHVVGGLGGLSYISDKLHRSTLRKSTLSVATKYWHFMGLLWAYLLILLWVKV